MNDNDIVRATFGTNQQATATVAASRPKQSGAISATHLEQELSTLCSGQSINHSTCRSSILSLDLGERVLLQRIAC